MGSPDSFAGSSRRRPALGKGAADSHVLKGRGNEKKPVLRLILILSVLAAAAPSQAQPDCGSAVEIRRVQIENAYRGGRMSADAYYAARVRIEESAAACRAGQGLPPSFQVTPPGQPAAPAHGDQITPQGLRIPGPR
jgi:hypothetical protein